MIPEEITMGFFDKLKSGLQKTRNNITVKIEQVFGAYKELDDDFFDELEEALIIADVGVPTASHAIETLRTRIFEKRIKSTDGAREELRNIIIELLDAPKLETPSPCVLFVVGVNGVGKTTTIGKLAHQFKKRGYSVTLGAADTFRAAAIEQLEAWAQRADVPIVTQKMGSDPAAVAYDTVASAIARKSDVVIIDTAGRLHNKTNLMNELVKIKNVIKKLVPDGPHDVLLVLDGSTGQNAFEQAKQFSAATEVSSLAITKLDGTAKGGVVIGISDQFKIPIKYIGVGEKIDQLQVFNRMEFVDSLFPDNW